MKQKTIILMLLAGISASCENINQLVTNVSNELSESSERIETEIYKSTDQIKNEVLKNVNLESITNEILNPKHVENIENVALKVVEYQNIVERISNLQENLASGEVGALEILAITQFAKQAQHELNQLKQGNTSVQTTQKIDSLLNSYQKILNTYPNNQRQENEATDNETDDE